MQSWHAGQRERKREALPVGKLLEPDSIMHLNGIFYDEPSCRDMVVLDSHSCRPKNISILAYCSKPTTEMQETMSSSLSVAKGAAFLQSLNGNNYPLKFDCAIWRPWKYFTAFLRRIHAISSTKSCLDSSSSAIRSLPAAWMIKTEAGQT